MADNQSNCAHKEKAAFSSVLAAVGLTVFKIIVGFMTGSLGIIAEAAHSGFDLIAAIMTFFAVRISSKPADRDHLYGHGKAENLSALFETVLLLVTCFWIIYEAVQRLIHKNVDIQVTFWSFAVMIVSIIVDVSRSRMLYKAARDYKSQALEADALHFSTDIWSSSVVIVGLVCVMASDWFKNADFLHYADCVAAIVVGFIAIKVSVEMGNRTIHELLDTAPAGLADRVVRVVNSFSQVSNCHNVRIRHSGAQTFVDLHILVNGSKTLFEVHALTDEIEAAICKVAPDADVTVHPEPK